eukprot:2077399-Alexandrium_andersonii.AAC.1
MSSTAMILLRTTRVASAKSSALLLRGRPAPCLACARNFLRCSAMRSPCSSWSRTLASAAQE